jgi:segregation and condensation protein B
MTDDPNQHHDDGEQPCSDLPLTARIEALLLSTDRPLTEQRLAALLGLSGAGSTSAVKDALAELNEQCEKTGRSFRAERLAGGWQLLTVQQFAPLLARLHTDRQQTRLSQAALETLSIVAYRQPIMRAEIEAIRGVACGEVLRSLMERRLIKITGRAEELGRPMLYGTTNEFLKVFGLSSVDDLPDVQGLKEDRSKKKSEKEAKSQAGEAEQSADENSGEADSNEPAAEDASSREENADAVSR